MVASISPETTPAIRQALAVLLQAHNYASMVERSTWEFAVEIHMLRAAGVSVSDLRWLKCKAYVDHATERIANGNVRTFQQCENLSFYKKTCFVLTSAGAHFARSLFDREWIENAVRTDQRPLGNEPRLGWVPVWDSDRQTLRLGDSVVKLFKTPAANQEAILSAFEEEGWPARIDDPLPPQHGQDPKSRLHDTINALNRNQKRRLIRFLGDGRGQGVRWELVDEASRVG